MTLTWGCSPPETTSVSGPRTVFGTFADVQGAAVTNARVVGRCIREDGSEFQIRVLTDEQGHFEVSNLPSGHLNCDVQSVDMPDGIQSAAASFDVAVGEGKALSLVARKGARVEVSIDLNGEAPEDGNVIYVQPDQILYAEVDGGRASFSALEAGGRLYFRGREENFPNGPAAGCTVIVPHTELEFTPSPTTIISLRQEDLRNIRVSFAEPRKEQSLSLYRRDARVLGPLSPVLTGDGTQAFFACIPPGSYDLDWFVRGELQRVPVDMNSGTGPVDVPL